MPCECCGRQLNIGTLHKYDDAGNEYKSCPRCSDTNGHEHVFHRHPESFGQTDARVTPRNPDGDQSYCVDCRTLDKGAASRVHSQGTLCRRLKQER